MGQDGYLDCHVLDTLIAYPARVSHLPNGVMLSAQVISLMFAVNMAVGIILNAEINAVDTISDF